MDALTNQTLWDGWIPSAMLDESRQRVAKINTRAIAKGFPVATLTVIEMEVRSINEFSAKGVEYAHVTITAPVPLAFGGWHLMGVLEVLDNDKPFVRKAPGADGIVIPTDLLADPKRCDHCHTRRARLETFVLRRDGELLPEWTVVGRDCLRDFLGHDPSALIAYTRDLLSLNWGEESWGGRDLPPVYRFEDIVTLSARVAAKVGFLGRAKAALVNKAATRDHIEEFSDTRRVDPRAAYSERVCDRANREFPLDEAAETLAANTIVALNDLVSKENKSDWEASIADLWEAQTIRDRHLGYAVSAVLLGLRMQERKATREAAPESVYFSTVGQRVRGVSGTVTFTRDFDGDYGRRTLVKFRVDGSDVNWWASGGSDLRVGDTVTFDGSVKSQEVDKYTGKPVTTLTRVTVKGTVKVAA